MLEIQDLTISTATRRLVNDLSLTLPGNGITALIGPSGCGKTSVLKWLAGIPTTALQAAGSLLLDGVPCPRPHPLLSYQPQHDALFPWLTIAENAALGLQVSGMARRAAMTKALSLFPSFDLVGCEGQYPSQLSGGMRQRAAFLRTMVQESRFVLLDEPFSALDAVTRIKMQIWLLDRLAERPRSVLMVTHDLHEASLLADRILVMAAAPGRIIADIPVTLPHGQRGEVDMAPLRDTLKSLLLEQPCR